VGRVTPLRKTTQAEQTTAQEKFWSLLQEEGNRTLPLQELCRMAGYRSMGPWYQALKDDEFRAHVEALGVATRRQVVYPTPLIPLAQNADEEWSKDVIDVRRLIADYPKHRGAGDFRLNFLCITHPKLRELVKRYFRVHVTFWEAATFVQELTHMKPFFFALGEIYPEMATFAELTRPMIEPLLTCSTWTTQRGHVHPISSYKRYRMILSLETMFIYMQLHGWEGAPTSILIYDEDRPKRSRRRPRPIPQPIFEQLQQHLHLLQPYDRNLIEILSVAGLRAEDALHLPEDCLEYDAAGDPRLHWFNHKLKRDGRPLPITTDVAEAIVRQRELVKGVDDHFGKRYLFRTENGLYRFEAFWRHLNEVASQVPILGPNGEVYHFTPHAFRHMVGTQMINNGMGIADVMAYLDHMSPEMTLCYAEIDNDALQQKFKALVLSGRAVGGAALKALKEQLEQGDESELDWVVSNLRKLSLPWGQCLHHAKANKCPYGQTE
jgi:integrase